MSWIELHEGVRDHWKVHRLSDYLKIEYPHALGCLSSLWLWAVQNAPKGLLKNFSDREICRAMMLKSDTIKIKKILMDCALLDKNFQIHDWRKHGISYLESHRKSQKKYREKQRHGDQKKNHGDITTISQFPINQTRPNQTKPNNINTKRPPPKKAGLFQKARGSPREDLCKLEISGLSSRAKGALYGRILKIFRARGWDTEELPLIVLKSVADLSSQASPKQRFPYVRKVLENYCNENAEMLSAQSRIIRQKQDKNSTSNMQEMGEILKGILAQ